jgi:hypothetical protein
VSRSSLQGFGVIEGDEIQENVGNNGVGRANERLAAAGAFLEVQPNHVRPRLLFESLCDGSKAAS